MKVSSLRAATDKANKKMELIFHDTAFNVRDKVASAVESFTSVIRSIYSWIDFSFPSEKQVISHKLDLEHALLLERIHHQKLSANQEAASNVFTK